MKVYRDIKRLINYGIKHNLITQYDEIYVRNRILEILDLNTYEDTEIEAEDLDCPQPILDNLLDYAYQKKIIPENTITYRDLLDTKIMDCFLPLPSEVIKRFYERYKESPEVATAEYYDMAQKSNYIRRERISKNLSWKTSTYFGELEITINLSKPEKDPIAIAAAKNLQNTSYPRCLLCKENEGYAGGVNHPARQNHRTIPIQLCDENWYLQFSPYVYYNEHAIVFKDSHEPMKITSKTFERLLAFVEKFPHYFIGSNADLPIVGGSILSHDHFQGGKHIFPMEVAPIQVRITSYESKDLAMGILRWPMSVIRLRSSNKEVLINMASRILEAWREYTDTKVGIISHTKEEPHNTITPIARYKNQKFELDLVLRNNRRSEEHPLGIFHPHRDLHHIKKENIGLIEVMGLAVLPARLIQEMALLEECLLGLKSIEEYQELQQHKEWFYKLRDQYKNQKVDFGEILKMEVGRIFERILVDAGVFKQDATGLEAFLRFIHSLS